MKESDKLAFERLAKHKKQLEDEGYFFLRVVEGRGICGLLRFMFTVGLCEGIATDGFSSYEGRWCYPIKYSEDALMALVVWDGKNDPLGQWIKYKGKRGEYSRKTEPYK